MRRCVVTGGSGFLGRHVIDCLIREDPTLEIVVFDLHPYKHHDSAAEVSITSIAGDVTQLGAVVTALTDADTVIHCISADPMDNTNQKLMWTVNVEGTKNVIEACKQCKVTKLVHVSSASVVYNGAPLVDVDESYPYPSMFRDYYSMTKAHAEKLVLAASKGGLATCALRPSAIFGERDRMFLPRFIEAARAGKSKYIIGSGTNVWDMTYVGNIAEACVLAARKLSPDSALSGQAYFINNTEPVQFWKYSGRLLEGLGYDKPRVCIPHALCYTIAVLIEFVLYILRPVYKPKAPPTFSRARITLLTTHRTFSCEKARLHFGYAPTVNMDEAAERTIEFFKPMAASAKQDKEE